MSLKSFFAENESIIKLPFLIHLSRMIVPSINIVTFSTSLELFCFKPIYLFLSGEIVFSLPGISFIELSPTF